MRNLERHRFYLVLLLFFSISCTKTAMDSPASSLPKAQDIPLAGGVWKTACLAAVSGQSIKMQIQFVSSGATYTNTLDIYNDSSCNTSVVTMVHTGTYLIGSPKGTSDGQFKSTEVDYYSVSDIDFTNQSINITPSSSGQVNYLNNQNFCGRNSWSLNTSVEVSGLTCLGSYLSDVGDVDYDIVEYYFSVKSNPLVANTAPGNLYFGLSEAGANGASASARRKTFNGNIVYRKQ
ncbi:MAG: hypothetical protein JNL11_09715 [Bdellovibrionaceae bacterium]|nr:hypothetical protein [Pseudobdellovibrionaceae bacterium]